jgi:hypothetical protein
VGNPAGRACLADSVFAVMEKVERVFSNLPFLLNFLNDTFGAQDYRHLI